MNQIPPRAARTQARDILSQADHVVVLTGAGISAESGVPTFRSADGLWKTFRAEDLATPEAFGRDPRLVWEWYGWRRELIAACAPNPGHAALARLALKAPGRTTLVTQNVDGLHHRAARAEAGDNDPSSGLPLELHGAIHRDRCSGCGRLDEEPAPVDATSEDTLPRCHQCAALMRPDVVWFGEALDHDLLGAAFAAAEQADVCLVVGTSALVYPAASVPDVTRSRGGVILEINPEATALSASAAVTLRGPAGLILPDIIS
jgi:NAD-dependent deacetylase